jgi:ABC-2 type transport system permease protein
MVVLGDFDRILLRPRSEITQIMCSQIAITKIGKLIQATVLFFWAITNLPLDISGMKILILIFILIGGVCIFGGIFIIGATFSFWTIQGLEVTNILTHGGHQLSKYPINIYSKWLKRFFTFIIPFGCINYIPLMFILEKDNNANF